MGIEPTSEAWEGESHISVAFQPVSGELLCLL
jgi:hypothetical protein